MATKTFCDRCFNEVDKKYYHINYKHNKYIELQFLGNNLIMCPKCYKEFLKFLLKGETNEKSMS